MYCQATFAEFTSTIYSYLGATGALAPPPPQRPKRSTFLLTPSHPFPLFYSPHFFARSLTLVPRSLLPNRTETLDTQAITEATDGLLPITRVGSRIHFFLKENKVCIVPFLCGPLSKISAVLCGQK